jgi:uncharacterized protein (TIGR02611 family)
MARIAKVVTGFTLIIAGLLMLVLPGPGILTILAGLALVAQEFTWARRLSDWVKTRFSGTTPGTTGTPPKRETREDQLGG